jgi:hypothetical protein
MDLNLAGKVAVASRSTSSIITFLASDRAGNITGSNYVIDGGLIKTT